MANLLAVPCSARVELGIERRGANALNIEIGAPSPRCMNKRPEHWPASASALRWLASGGTALVLGACSNPCPLKPF
jgi:hypothetical protein